MTNTQLKAGIDTDITNKTLPKSVLNTNLGARMKSTVDYIDQQDGFIFDYIDQQDDLKANIADLSPVATSNDYNDLDNLPTIPQASTQILKTQKTIINSSQILNLHNTIVPIVTGEAGKIKTILSYVIVYEYGNTAYTQTGSGILGFHYGNYGSIGYITPAFVNYGSSSKWQYYNLNGMGNMQYYTGEETIGLKLTSGNYNGGDGSVTFYANYIETIL